MPDPEPDAGTGPGSAADEHAELERLRDEVAELRARQADVEAHAGGGTGGGRRGLRWTACAVLVVLASLLSVVAVVARYARSQLLDTDHYVATVSPLADNPDVQNAIATQVTNEIFSRLDVQDITQQALQKLTELGAPDVIEGLAGPIAAQVETFTREEVTKAVSSPQFAQLWDEANRAAHSQVVAVLTGNADGAVSFRNGALTVDLGTLVDRVKQRLIDRGFSFAQSIPEVRSTFTLIESDQLTKAQRTVRRLDRVATVLPFVIIVLAALAVLVAPNRRRGLLIVALGLAAAMVLLALALALVRNWYLDNGTPRTMTPEAAVGIARTLLAPLRLAMRAVLVLALAVALTAFLTGPSGAARAVRSFFARLRGRIQQRVEGERRPSAVESWVGAHKMPLRIVAVVLGVLVLAFWTYPSGAVVAAIVLAVLVALAAIEILGWSRPETTRSAAG